MIPRISHGPFLLNPPSLFTIEGMKSWIVLTITLLVTSVLYLSLWSAQPLTWDDTSNIFANPYFTMHHWWGIWLEPYFGLYVPITSSAWAFLYWVGGGEGWPFRLFNTLLHAANTVVLFLLLKQLAQRWKINSDLAPALAITLFALHPLQVESVAWISGGRDLLSTLLALLTVLIYFRHPNTNGYLTATMLFALALMSKPSVVVLPPAVMALDVLLCGRSWRSSAKRMSLWLLMVVAVTIVTQRAQVEHFTNRVEWWQRPLVMLDTYVFYLQKILWPFLLSGNYGRTPENIIANSSTIWLDALKFIPVVGLLFLAWWRDRRYLLLAALWFLLLLPVSGVIPFGYENVSQVADHYVYLPMAILAALLLLIFDKFEKWPALVAAASLMLASAWAWASWQRVAVWQNQESFFSDMAKTSPESYNTAIGMSVVLCQDKHDYDSGLEWLEKALKAKPDDIVALSNRAYCLAHAGRRAEVLAMDSVLDRLDLDDLAENQPTAYSSFLASLGTAFIEEQEFKAGFEYFCEANRVKPSEPVHAQNLKVAAEILRQKGLDPNCTTQP